MEHFNFYTSWHKHVFFQPDWLLVRSKLVPGREIGLLTDKNDLQACNWFHRLSELNMFVVVEIYAWFELYATFSLGHHNFSEKKNKK